MRFRVAPTNAPLCGDIFPKWDGDCGRWSYLFQEKVRRAPMFELTLVSELFRFQ